MTEADTPPTQVQRILQDFFHDIPQRLLSEMIVDKFAEQGVAISIDNANAFAKSTVIRNEENEPVAFRKALVHILIDLKLAHSEEDFSDALGNRARLFTGSLQSELDKLSTKTARDMLRDDEKKWPEVSRSLRVDQNSFRIDLYRKWKGPIEKLRMLQTICFELGSEFARDLGETPPKGKESLYAVTILSHMRACQIADEILCLIEGGFADGSMARARSLHELAIISMFVLKHGEDVARRYFAHKIIDLKKDADQLWCRMQHDHGDVVLKENYEKICEEYDKAVREFGEVFRRPYGWAAICFGGRNPRFDEIESDICGREARYFYRSASQSIHVGSRNMYSRLGLQGDGTVLLSQPSDVGFADPGKWTALSLTMVTVSLCGLRDASRVGTAFEFTTAYKLLMECSNSVAAAFESKERA